MMSTLTATPDQISSRSRRYRSARPNAPARDVALMAPVHVAESNALAERDAEASHLSYYREVARVIRAGLAGNPDGSSRRVPLAERFGSITFEESITSDSAVGDPDRVVERLTALHDRHGFGHLMAWFAFGAVSARAGAGLHAALRRRGAAAPALSASRNTPRPIRAPAQHDAAQRPALVSSCGGRTPGGVMPSAVVLPMLGPTPPAGLPAPSAPSSNGM